VRPIPLNRLCHTPTQALRSTCSYSFQYSPSLLRILAVIAAVIPSTNSVTTSPPHQWLVPGLLRSSVLVSGEVNKLQTHSFTLQIELSHFSWCCYLKEKAACSAGRWLLHWVLYEVDANRCDQCFEACIILCSEMNNDQSAVKFVSSLHKSQ